MNVCVSFNFIFIDIPIISILFVVSSSGHGVYYAIEKGYVSSLKKSEFEKHELKYVKNIHYTTTLISHDMYIR